ncbi:MAG TPA: hypothetical protein DCZ69_00035 [Syntrophobacteraceae bacterium]|nr:hypothetical protein [Syntrophobacteraceae bacterium]
MKTSGAGIVPTSWKIPGAGSRLYVDDEEIQREVLRQILERDNHTVEVADGGQAGLEAFHAANLRGEPFDVVISDLGMPYVDGREVARLVKRESPATPVILLTGWGERMRAEGKLPSGVDFVVSKPTSVNQIREALRESKHCCKMAWSVLGSSMM